VKDPNEVVSARFTPGQAVEVKDAHGQWLSAVADSSIERGHRFFRVWVIVGGHRCHGLCAGRAATEAPLERSRGRSFASPQHATAPVAGRPESCVSCEATGLMSVPTEVSQALRYLSRQGRLSHVVESPKPDRPALTCEDKPSGPARSSGHFADLTQVDGTNRDDEPSHLLESNPR